MQEHNIPNEDPPRSSEKEVAPLHDRSSSAKKHHRTKKNQPAYVWVIKAIIISLVLSCAFGFGTEFALSDAAIAVYVVLLVVLIAIAVLFDMMGLAVASCDIVPLTSMASRKIKGAKHALALCKKANVVSSVCNDIISDTIGITTGACGAALALILSGSLTGVARLAITVAVSAIISAATVGGKAAMKNVALQHSTKIVLIMGRFIALFKKERRK